MDAAEAELDIKLQKISGDLIADFDRALATCLRKSDGHGGTQIRSWVRTNQALRSTCGVLDMFQELPQLLDPNLPKWIPVLAEAYLEHRQASHRVKRDPNRAHLLSPLDQVICKILYSFCKVRGEKVIVRFFSAEARHLEMLLSAIEEAEEPTTDDAWEQRYIVLLWLSHLLLAPFDLSTISSMDIEDDKLPSIPGLTWTKNLPGITMRVIPLAIKYLESPGKERDAAKALLVRTAMRRDMQQLGVLDGLVTWALKSLRFQRDAPLETTYFYLGVLSLLAGMLQSAAETSDMDKYQAAIFEAVYSISTGDDDLSKTISSLALARKTMLKVIRSVIVSMLRQSPKSMKTTELTETAIGYLLESLSDNDTPVRLAASKALSIITLKLDPDMASQVVEAVLESLNQNVLWKKSSSSDAKPARDLSAVSNVEWHGLMLTLSHLLYRRSPPARQLSDIVHALLLGLSFEQRGASGASVGANVRDAACFGIWALARRYSTEELLAVPTESVFAAKSHPSSSHIIQVLGTELATTACLDPAGNIRRGASAALQELIGRHPDMVERGIEVVQTVDYHSVARRSRAIATVATGVTKLAGQYGEALLDGILGWRGIGDMDTPSRRVLGAAFGVITAYLSLNSDEDSLPRLENSIRLITETLASLQKRQVEERHGLLTCFAGVLDQVPELHGQGKGDGGRQESFQSLLRTVCTNVCAILDDCKMTVYRRPDIIAESASRLVVSSLPILKLIALPASQTLKLETGEQLLSQSRAGGYVELASTLDSADAASHEGVEAFTLRLGAVVADWLNEKDQDIVESTSAAALMFLVLSKPGDRISILNNWARIVRDKPASQANVSGRGYFYALAMAQPLAAQMASGARGCDLGCVAFLERWKVEDDIETKVTILRSLLRSRVLQSNPVVFLDLLADGLADYTTVARGDIGSLVRYQAMRAVAVLWENLDDVPVEETWVEESVRKLMYSVLRLSAEKLDRVRPQAQIALALTLQDGRAQHLASLINSSQAYFETLLNLVSLASFKPRVSKVIENDINAWMSELMAGFVTSADTGNDALVLTSRAALAGFCEASPTNLGRVCTALLHNLRTRQSEDRIVVPTLEIIAFLFHVDLFPQCKEVNLRGLCLQTQKASYKTGNIRKILACIKVYGGVATGDGESVGVQEARRRLGALMMHPWPRVRSAVVDELWRLLGHEDDGKGDVLLGVDWAKADKGRIKATMDELKLV